MTSGKAIIVSAPSGSGKTTVVKHLLDKYSQLAFSISASTRAPRQSYEKDGKDYYFLTEEEFRQKINAGDFIEWEEVYPGKLYGTLKSEVSRLWEMGKVVIFDVDVKGGVSLKNHFGQAALSIFIKVPDMEELKSRLSRRKTESEEDYAERIEKAMEEMNYAGEFDVILINDNLGDTLRGAERIYEDFVAPK